METRHPYPYYDTFKEPQGWGCLTHSMGLCNRYCCVGRAGRRPFRSLCGRVPFGCLLRRPAGGILKCPRRCHPLSVGIAGELQITPAGHGHPARRAARLDGPLPVTDRDISPGRGAGA
jgi:hypothetical protein